MRLCGHDRVVSDRYDSGSVGSGRYFYRLDPQDALNFGRNFLSLSINAAPGRYPHAGPRIGTHMVHAGTHGTGKGLICNARGTRSYIARDLSRTGWRTGTRAGDRVPIGGLPWCQPSEGTGTPPVNPARPARH